MNTKQLTAINTLLPDFIKLPHKLNTLKIRVWYTDKLTRAYLLGRDIIDGIPSDDIISEKLQNNDIETYVFPNLQGKHTINIRTSMG